MRKLSIKAFISSVVSLSAIAAGSLATGAPALAADFTNDNVFTVVGQNNPETDPANVQEAVNAAFLSVGEPSTGRPWVAVPEFYDFI